MDSRTRSRRDVLREAAALALIGLHAGPLSAFAQPRQAQGRVRLLHLTLETSATLSEMKQFYGGLLGLAVREDSAARLTVAAGATALTFTPTASRDTRPFYHFAFNIPENKITQALEWQAARSPLISIPERLRDARYPGDIVNYAHWNAHSVFFLDPGGNVVEYIARHDLANARGGPFGPADILCASEIAFVVDDVPAAAQTVRARAALSNFRRGGDSNFMALGDDEGLVLVMKRGRILDFNPASQAKAAAIFPTGTVLRGAGAQFGIDGFPYQIALDPG